MKIFARTRTLVSATLHDWFDGLERPERLARHSLRELTEALENATAAVARSIAAERWLTRCRDEIRGQLDRWDRRASDALRDGAEPKARLALTQKFAAAEAIAALDGQLAEASEVNRGLRAQLETMRDRYRRAKQRLDAQVSRHALASAARQFAAATAYDTDDLDRFERSTLELEVHAELNQDATIAEAEFAGDRLDRYVREELKRLRTASGEPGA